MDVVTGELNANEALAAIQSRMNGIEWDADTLDDIAAILELAGYPVRDLEGWHGRHATESATRPETHQGRRPVGGPVQRGAHRRALAGRCADMNDSLNPPFMSYTAFEKTGYMTCDLGMSIGDDTLDMRRGWVFLDHWWVEETKPRNNAECYLLLGRCDWVGGYDELVSRLYLYVAAEYGWNEVQG